MQSPALTKLHIELIINASHYGEENFFTDSKKAASTIMKYLEDLHLLIEEIPEIFVIKSAI